MKIKRYLAIVLTLLAIVSTLLACGGGTTPTPKTAKPTAAQTKSTPASKKPTPTTAKSTPAAKPTKAPAGGGSDTVEVVSTFVYKDSFETFHIVGLVQNNSAQAVDNIELTLTVKDAQGKTLLTEDEKPAESVTFWPLLSTILPNSAVPFDYTLDADNGEPKDAKVEVTNQRVSGVQSVEIAVENVDLTGDEDYLYLSGELVNRSNKPAQVRGVAGTVLTADQSLLAANTSWKYAGGLAPAGDKAGRDRTPFLIRLSAPPELPKKWGVYWNVMESDEFPAHNIALDITAQYLDSVGSYHVVGTAANKGKTAAQVNVVAGLYGKDGKMLDADSSTLPVQVGAGETVPFDLHYFSTINLPDRAVKIDHATLQLDPYWTATEYLAETVHLESANNKDEDQGDGRWIFTGEVTNTTAKELSYVTVLLYVTDKDKKVVAVASTTAYAEGSDTIPPKQMLSYEIYVYTDPALDATGLKFSTIVQGNVKQ